MSVLIDVVSKFNDAGIDKARKELDKLSESTATTSQKMMRGAAAAGAGILAGATAIGVGLYAIGSQFDDAFDTIRVGTGATGDALEGLKNDMKAVASAVPTSFGDAGTAVAELNTRLGLTGAPLQTMSQQMLELSRITKSDLQGNLTAVSAVMQNFGISSDQQSSKLDLLFRASQNSGLSVQELGAQMSDAGVVLRELGLGFDQSAALLATLGKAGVNVGDVMPAMSRALATAAKEGKDASTVFSDTFAAIKNAPSDVAASGVALEVFGAKAGPKLAALIREGKLSYEDMMASIADGDSIMKAGSDTQDFGEKLTTLKNRVFLAIEPIATRVFNAIGDAVDKLSPKIEELAKWMTENGDAVKIAAGIIGGIALVAIGAYTVSMAAAAAATIAAAAPILAIIAVIGALVAAFVWAYNNIDAYRAYVDFAWNAIQNIIKFAWNNVIKPVWEAISWYIQNILVPYFTTLWNIAKSVFDQIADKVMWAWNTVIKPVWDAIYWYIENILIPYYTLLWNAVKSAFDQIASKVMWAWNNVIKPAWDAISWYISNILVPYFTTIWNTVRTVFDAVGSVISWVWQHVISPAFNRITGGIGLLISVFSSIKDTVVNTFSGIFDVIVSPIRNAINWVIRKWNGLEFNVPRFEAFGISVGGGTIGTPDIPEFATGGVFQAPTPGGAGLALLHDGEMILNARQQQQMRAGGDVNVYVTQSDASPYEIGREVVWSLRVAG